MDALVKATPEPTGSEWLTIGDFAKRYGVKAAQAGRRLTALLEAGKVERWSGKQAKSSKYGHKFRAIL